MTSKKQIEANRKNSKKSTGAITADGKANVSTNAIKHGVFSNRLVLPNESESKYQELLIDLMDSLKPVGKLELILTEKIAVTVWRQLRLSNAESAYIQTNISIDNRNLRHQVNTLAGNEHINSLSKNDFNQLSNDDYVQIDWCKAVIKEIDSLHSTNTATLDEIKQLPKTFGQVKRETKAEKVVVEEYLSNYRCLNGYNDGINGWLKELQNWCRDELKKYKRKKRIIELLPVVQDRESLPITNELLTRYQITLDNELYKALKALREQQQWRLNTENLKEVI